MANNVVNGDSYAFAEGITKAEFESANFAASRITSGTLASARLPTVPVSKGGTGATTAEGAREFLNAANKYTLLWQNDSISSNFAGQTITLSDASADYNLFVVVYQTDYALFPAQGTSTFHDTQLVYVPSSGLTYTYSKPSSSQTPNGQPLTAYRNLTINWSSSTRNFVFGNGVLSATTTLTENNAVLKPYYIFGCTL